MDTITIGPVLDVAFRLFVGLVLAAPAVAYLIVCVVERIVYGPRP